MKSSARPLARAGIASALSVLVLLLASVLPTARLALVCLASLGPALCALHDSPRWALGCFAAAALLSLLLLPQKGVSLGYAVFAGYYPVLKLRLERLGNRLHRLAFKLAVFNAALAVLWLGFHALSAPALPLGRFAVPAGVLIANAAFLVYDYALDQIILFYLRKIAGRVK